MRPTLFSVASLALVAAVGCGAAPDSGAENGDDQAVMTAASLAGDYTSWGKEIQEVDLRVDGTFHLTMAGIPRCGTNGPLEPGYECSEGAHWSGMHGTWVPTSGGVMLTPKVDRTDSVESAKKVGTPVKLSLQAQGSKVLASMTFPTYPTDAKFASTLDVRASYKTSASTKLSAFEGTWDVTSAHATDEMLLGGGDVLPRGGKFHQLTVAADGTYTETSDIPLPSTQPSIRTGTIAMAGSPNGDACVFVEVFHPDFVGRPYRGADQIVSVAQDKIVLRHHLQWYGQDKGEVEVTLTRAK